MEFFTFWARAEHNCTINGQEYTFAAWGASNTSQEHAQQEAAQKSQSIAERYGNGSINQYLYGDRLLREEKIESVQSGNEEIAVISRNNYGCLVLNTKQVMFIDVDIPASTPSFAEFIGGLFGKKYPSEQERLIQRIREFVAAQSQMGMRVYKTRAGFRCLLTSELCDPQSSRAAAYMDALEADYLYRKLCKIQKSFRARLTPKPWRIGQSTPPVRFPYNDPQLQAMQAEWVDAYHKQAADWHVCDLVETLGPDAQDDAIKTVVALHDKLCCQKSARGLA